MIESPVISIGMPVFNCRKTLHDAVVSILQQSFANWELLILDDGSTDGTAELARSFNDPRIRVFSDGSNRGLAARLNEAICQSRGEYFARMDGDDIAYPKRLALQLDYLLNHPEVDLVGGWALVFDSSMHARGRRMPPEFHADICAAPWRGFPLIHPTYMARKTWFEHFPYDERMNKAQDQVLLATSCLSSRFANVQEIVLAYREDLPGLDKLWSSRRCMMTGMFNAFTQRGKVWWAWCVVLAQTLRMAIDLAATVKGLRSLQVSKRSVNLDVKDDSDWKSLLRQLHANDASHE
ncbi:glycosyltransferase family 2 protein [Mariprofundus ferrooxydans]|uniref:glycosyltransferase family 2 protein n=1 Tax=Mariprofundus ferrooxydans TaxID=314344 RepID=UPI0014320B46|nr:glycosyltransferase [Mariprofundus ferrooxydans]